MEKAWPAGEAAEQKEVQQEDEQEEKNTHVRHLGVPVMGLDLLAEMKARQEKMAVKKVSPPPHPEQLPGRTAWIKSS